MRVQCGGRGGESSVVGGGVSPVWWEGGESSVVGGGVSPVWWEGG